MRIVLISDTHGLHRRLLKLPKGDVIIHAGDVTNVGRPEQAAEFINWFGSLDYKHKIFIAGNHDFVFQNTADEKVRSLLPEGMAYLNDSIVDIDGFKIWGSPITPTFLNWAFMRGRGDQIRKHWDAIPEGVDMILTHGPAYGILDECADGHVGCEDLLARIREVKPKYHVGGHIHEGYGQADVDGVNYINPSVLNENYSMVNKPILINV